MDQVQVCVEMRTHMTGIVHRTKDGVSGRVANGSSQVNMCVPIAVSWNQVLSEYRIDVVAQPYGKAGIKGGGSSIQQPGNLRMLEGRSTAS